ncbi:MAG: hypothetical protein AAF665_17585 [Pseudomonadota bacterium]
MRVHTLLIALYAALAGSLAEAQDRQPSQPVFRYAHESKVVCGRVGGHETRPMARGLYGTVVNLYNPYAAAVTVTLSLRLASPPGKLTPGDVVDLSDIELPAEKAVAVDCRSVKAAAFSYGLPGGFIEGMLTADALQPLVVTSAFTAAAIHKKHDDPRLSSLDIEHIPARAIEVAPADPEWPQGGFDLGLCDTLERTSAIVSGVAASQSYTFDEAPDEGPREVTRFEDITVLAGDGAVVGGPLEIRLSRGLMPEGQFVDTSEMPIITPGERYLLLLPNHAWVIEPVALRDVFRIETLDGQEILVDQDGYAVTSTRRGRSFAQVSTRERLFQSPEMVEGAQPGDAMSPEAFAAELVTTECDNPTLTGPFTAYPLVPDIIRGAD